MKTTGSTTHRGSVLLVTMIFIVIVATALGSYLVLIQNSNHLVNRAQSWNSALSVAEAGIEEAMARLNSGDTSFNQTRTLNDGTYTYELTYLNTNLNAATLRSKGTTSVPGTGDTVSRTVEVKARRVGVFSMGLVAMKEIDFNGNDISVSSWNSYDPAQSLNGQWNGYVGTNGDVAAVGGEVDIGQHIINGDLYLGPTATYDSSASQVNGTIFPDVNLYYPDAELPTKDVNGVDINWSEAPVVTIGTGKTAKTAHSFTINGYYDIGPGDSLPIVVAPDVDVTLRVRNSNWKPTTIDINGGTTNSGNVIVYAISGSITVGGGSTGGAIGNRPENFHIFGLPNLTSITLGGSSDFVGAIYAPQATLTLNGGGSAVNFSGAAVVGSVKLNGHYDFHYDESLGRDPYYRGYVVVGWTEL